MSSINSEKEFADHKIISSESKSWFVGKPGTIKNSFSVTWSPGAIVLYGEKGNITLIYAKFNSYENTKTWLSTCKIEEFESVVAHNPPENIEFYYHALKHWGLQKHFK
jgi:hypothetical protein